MDMALPQNVHHAPTAPPGRQTYQLPMQTRQARFEPKSVDADARTIELCWTTGATVRRHSWFGDDWDEQLMLDEGSIRMDRLNSGASLLNSHNAYDLGAVLGVVERAWMDGKGKNRQGKALVRFSDRDEVEPVWRDVQSGIIRNVSVGYAIHRVEKHEKADEKIPLVRVVDWEPYELSMVAVPADAGAQVRGEQTGNIRTFPCILERNTPMDLEQTAASGATAAVAADPKTPPQPEPSPQPQPQPSEPGPAAMRNGANGAHTNGRDAGGTVLTPPAQAQPAGISEDEFRRRMEIEVAERLRVEQERIAGIQLACRTLKLESEIGQRLITQKIALAQAQTALFEEAAKRREAKEAINPVRIEPGEQNEDDIRGKAIRSAILHRYDPHKFKLEFGAENYIGRSLLEQGRICMEAAGVTTARMQKAELAKRALEPGYGVRAPSGYHTTSDFGNILADVANKTLRAAYEMAPRTYTPFTRRTTAPDFKTINRMALGEGPLLLVKNEHGEFTRGTIGDAKESYALATYGRIFAITREVIINDDMDAFTRAPALFGNQSANKESEVVWAILTANANMGDGTPLFHANHGNLAGAAAAIAVGPLGLARAAMRVQKGIDGTTLINAQPRYLIVPAAQETLAEQFLNATVYPATTATAVPESMRRSLTLIVEPRLDANSTTAWYLSADPSQIDTIEYAFLEGEEGVMIDSRVGFDIDGVEIRARLDFAAKAIDWRGMYKNAGA